MKNIVFTVLCIGLALSLVFSIGEIVLRMAGIGEVQERETIWVKHTPFNPFLIFGPYRNNKFKLKNGTFANYNSQGFRLDNDVPHQKPEDEFRIIALGGSTTANLGNERGLHYPDLATEQLNQRGFTSKKILALNTGVPAYTTAHSLVRLQFDLLPFKPNMITVMHNINDLHVNYFPYEDQEQNNYGNTYFHEKFAHRLSIKQIPLLRKSRVLVFFFNSLQSLKQQFFGDSVQATEGKVVYTTMKFSKSAIPLKSKINFQNNLITIANIAKTHHIALVFMTQPSIMTEEMIAGFFGHKEYNDIVWYPEKAQMTQHFREYNDVIRNVAQKEGVYLIDMAREFGKDRNLFDDMVHYSSDGVQRFADIYARHIETIIKIEENALGDKVNSSE
ncbi:MAG: SGNH/GDSL hydrolase family protein [Nitrospirales bacterium]